MILTEETVTKNPQTMKLPIYSSFGPRELNSQIAHHALQFLISLLKPGLAFPFSR